MGYGFKLDFRKLYLHRVTNVTISSGQTITAGASLGNSIYFDGVDDYLSFSNSSGQFEATGDFTFEAWVNWSTLYTGEMSPIFGGQNTHMFHYIMEIKQLDLILMANVVEIETLVFQYYFNQRVASYSSSPIRIYYYLVYRWTKHRHNYLLRPLVR